MQIHRKLSMSLMGIAVLLAACGGGSSGGGTTAADSATPAAVASAPAAASAPDVASAPEAASSAQPAAFNCPTNDKRLDVAVGTAAGTPMTLVTDDNIATLTFRVPPDGVTRALTICLGKPDPLPAGVQADYAYEVTASGNNILAMTNLLLTFNFTTTQPVTGIPALELASVTAGGVTYAPTTPGPLFYVKPNYGISGYVTQTGLYVVRLSK
jgi:hypothetical protein